MRLHSLQWATDIPPLAYSSQHCIFMRVPVVTISMQLTTAIDLDSTVVSNDIQFSAVDHSGFFMGLCSQLCTTMGVTVVPSNHHIFTVDHCKSISSPK